MFYHEELLRSYRTIQLSGRLNMLDMWGVYELAECYRLTDLSEFINDFGSEEYTKMIKSVSWNDVVPYESILNSML